MNRICLMAKAGNGADDGKAPNEADGGSGRTIRFRFDD